MKHSRNFYIANFLLIFTQISFGGGIVLGKIALNGEVKPVIFAFIREALAGPILFLIAYFAKDNSLKDNFYSVWYLLLLTSLSLFGNQLLFILGLSLSTPTTAAIWQPSQPIITVVLSLLLHLETLSIFKTIGILSAVIGAFLMVYTAISSWIASVCFICNCICSSLYVIFSKYALSSVHPISVTAVSYVGAAIMMAITSLYYINDDGVWNIDTMTWISLSYWIIFCSVLAYAFITWSNKYIDPSLVSTYATLQPLAAILLEFMIFGTRPSYKDLGGIAILIGLILVVFDKNLSKKFCEYDYHSEEHKSDSDSLLTDSLRSLEGGMVDKKRIN